MSWQKHVFQRLREAPDERWLCMGDLFDEVRTQIPLHFAMRHYLNGRNSAPIPSNDRAQWLYFSHTVREMGIDREGLPRRARYSDRIRLRYVEDKSCESCHGPVIKASWSLTTSVCCLACERRPQPMPQPKRPIIEGPLLRPMEPQFVTIVTMPTDLVLTPGEKAKGGLEVRTQGLRIIAHRRTLARELKPLLNVSLNRLETELARHNDNINAVLALHGKASDILPMFFTARVAARAMVERWRSGKTFIGPANR